ncbi:MAG TPA: hypothetical protein VGB24_21260 [Longimicrobium sp.]|uniref:hypothetical protein n=1 Tax=Longimicrobium sp. TaxID=2029185 RepID=UPI002ED9B44C
MTDGLENDEPVFPGSGGSASLVEWVDGLLVALNEGRTDEVRTALRNEEWRTGWDLSGIPAPIQEQFAEALARAAGAIASGSADETQDALLIARSRFLPGA